MSFDINKFKGSISEWGVSKQSHFDVFFTIPGTPTSSVPTMAKEHLAFRCESAEMPGQSLATVEHRVIGPARKMAYGNIYTDINLTMLCSYNLREKIFFDEWMDFISGVNNKEQEDRYDVQYFNDYTVDVEINQYEPSKSKSVVYSVKLIKAYPISVSPLSLNHDSNEVHKLTVTLTFHKWEALPFTDKKLETRPPAPNFGAFAGVFGTAAGVLASQLPPGAAQTLGAATAIPSIMRNVGGILK